MENFSTGDVIDIHVYDGRVTRHGSDEVLAEFSLKTDVLLDEVRAGGRIPLIIGRGLTQRARESLGLEAQRLAEGQTADLTVLDPTRPWTVTPEALASRGKNTPFQGHRFTGRATLTIVAGEVVYTAPLGEEMS